MRQRASIQVAVIVLLAGTAAPRTQQSSPAPLDLATQFQVGGLFADSNDDGVVDVVQAHLVVGETPTPGEVVAAADVAARLGFETAAITLPLGAEGRPVVIGRGGIARAGLTPAQAGVADLQAGEGIVAMVDAAGTAGIVIAGADDAGTQAAAALFAGRLPRVWDPGGTTLLQAASDVRTFLAGQGVTVAAVSVPAIRVSPAVNGIDRLVVRTQLSSPTDVTRAQAALKTLVPTPKGAAAASAPRTQAPRPLSFASVRSVRVRLETPGAPPIDVDVATEAPAAKPRPLGRRPGASAKDGLDLSNLFAIDGLLGDSDENLIPDRVDALLVPAADARGTADLAARLGLESAGISIPIAATADTVAEPNEEPTLVLIGTSHPLIDRLVQEEKIDVGPLQPGQGVIRMVKKAFVTSRRW